jgi:uncharacterized OsmC-like protein
MSELAVPERSSDTREPSAVKDAESMRVRWRGGDRFAIEVRDHVITVDQPVEVGGADVGPTPTELFLASLGSCVAFYARRYLRRHHIDAEGLEVRTTYRMGARPNRVEAVDMEIQLPAQLSDNRRAGLLAQAGHCTVHNTITHTPDIAITLVPASQER